MGLAERRAAKNFQDSRFPAVKSSAKIGAAGPPLTVIDADVPLMEPGLFSESTASTV